MDRLFDDVRTGAFYLGQPSIADVTVEPIHYNGDILGHYRLNAFVVMPNHVHLLATPAVRLPKLTKSLKGITAKRPNVILGLAVAHSGKTRATTMWSGAKENSRRSATTLTKVQYGRG
jgi:hypothetical protein